MPWTYDPALTAPRDQVRFLIRDTDSAHPLFDDGELDFLLLQEEDNVWLAAAGALTVAYLASSRYASRSAGDVSVSYWAASEVQARIDWLLERGGAGSLLHQFPTAGGISRSDVERLRGNADWIPLSLRPGLFDNRSGSPRTVLEGDHR